MPSVQTIATCLVSGDRRKHRRGMRYLRKADGMQRLSISCLACAKSMQAFSDAFYSTLQGVFNAKP